jgi:hypothetical protein
VTTNHRNFLIHCIDDSLKATMMTVDLRGGPPEISLLPSFRLIIVGFDKLFQILIHRSGALQNKFVRANILFWEVSLYATVNFA